MAMFKNRMNQTRKVDWDSEIMVMLYDEFPSKAEEDLKEQKVRGAIEKFWRDPKEKPEWFVTEEKTPGFPPYLKVYATKAFEGIIDTGCMQIDALLTAATRDAMSLDGMAS